MSYAPSSLSAQRGDGLEDLLLQHVLEALSFGQTRKRFLALLEPGLTAKHYLI